MRKLYMGLWWFCFIQYPLYYFMDWANNRRLFSYITNFYIDTFGIYMIIIAPFMPLPTILTIILATRAWRKANISKLEIALAIGSWILSLFVFYRVFIVSGGHMS